MLADGASLNLCRYSDEPFNTNEVIWPHWSDDPLSSRRPSRLLAQSSRSSRARNLAHEARR